MRPQKSRQALQKLLGLIDLLPNGAVEYLSCQPYLRCSDVVNPLERRARYLSPASLKLFLNRLRMQKMSSIEPTRVELRTRNLKRSIEKCWSNARPLEGKVAIVTVVRYPSRGIAIELARSGCNIAIAAQN